MTITFQEMIRKLAHFWEDQGCIIHQPYDLETGAGTSNPATFLRCLGPEPYYAAYVEPCRRPTDGRYGTNPNRVQHYFQYQVILKPSPSDIQDLYLQSLEAIGIDLSKHDIRFVHDDWEQPTIGAWGLGWEVWMDGMEITQFTYFQGVGGVSLKPITGEITYGLERLALYIQGVDSFFDLQWNENLTYGDIYHQNEIEWSHYNFEEATTDMWFRQFDDYEKEAEKLAKKGFVIPAYDFVMKASHAFNILDARGVISVSHRMNYILRIRKLASLIAQSYIQSREDKGFPLIDKHPKKKEVFQELSEKVETLENMDKEDFVLEIGSEELPAAFVPIGIRNLKKAFENLLKDQNISYSKMDVYGAPRRLAVVIKDLQTQKLAEVTERRGPTIQVAFDEKGVSTVAAAGFFRSIGVAVPSLESIKNGAVANVEIRNVKDTEYLFAKVTKEGESTAKILQQALPKIVLGLEFPKLMRWGDMDITYARPLKWVVAIFGEHVIPFAVGNIVSGRLSEGHRQLAKGFFSLEKAQDYQQKLLENYVMVDQKQREQTIFDQLEALEASEGFCVIEKERVIPQVVHLCQWPLVTSMKFEERFLCVPKEVLVSEMVEHQKYFPVTDKEGNLINSFIITADTTPTEAIGSGNNKVLSARLADGAFLYDQDLKIPLEQFNEKLKNVTYQKGLGTIYNKVERILKHLEVLLPYFPDADKKKAQRAALLSKGDLASEMVYEFPDLQGVIGKRYALEQGEDSVVAQAIDEHWMPRGEGAPLPESIEGTLISLADKIDTIIGCFTLGLKPSSSSDPYALRRQVLGIIRMVIEGKIHLPIMEVFLACYQHFPSEVCQNTEEVTGDIEAFIRNRIKTVFQGYGVSKDEVEASIANGFSDIFDTFSRVKALHQFRIANGQFSGLLEVFRRARGQTNGFDSQNFSKELLLEEVERNLEAVVSDVEHHLDEAIGSHSYDQAYGCIAKLQEPLAQLFDKVRILDDDEKVKKNRIALLQRVFALFDQLLDFNKIQT